MLVSVLLVPLAIRRGPAVRLGPGAAGYRARLIVKHRAAIALAQNRIRAIARGGDVGRSRSGNGAAAALAEGLEPRRVVARNGDVAGPRSA